jgi:serine/threonine-protein kinase
MTTHSNETLSTPAPATRLAALVFTDLIGSTALKSTLGTVRYAQLLKRHNDLFEGGITEYPGAEIVKHTGDGYFAAFQTASDAVRFSLRFQTEMEREAWDGVPLQTRVGIHIGEVAMMDMAGRKDVVGLSADIAARLMSLAAGGQILLTATVFNDARQFVNAASASLAGESPLKWMAHGPYLFKGSDEPLDVYEVGIEKISPLTRPGDSEKARRVLPHDAEPMLGWRPAVALTIPGRPGWRLVAKLGEGGFGEVWLGQHERLKIHRVFKFCFNVDRLRSLKREYTLLRLLKEALGERADIAKLHEIKLDEPPFFLETEYAEGGNLLEWSERIGGIGSIPLPGRLELLAQIADAVAAAHSVGVLHKDIKPSNILVNLQATGEARLLLADFGIGEIRDRSKLRAHEVTETGFTELPSGGTSGSSHTLGTRMYAPPESLLDKPFTTHGDVYAMGVMLYQFAVGDLHRPLASGWERDIPDDLLREDIAEMVEGDPQRRIATATAVAERLRTLDARRTARENEAKRADVQRRRRRRRRLITIGSIAVGTLGILIGIGAAVYIRDLRAERTRTLAQKHAAEQSAAEAQAVTQFLTQMFESADPANTRGESITALEVVRRATTDVERSFSDQPLLKAHLQVQLSRVLAALWDYKEAEAILRPAIQQLESSLGADDPNTLRARSLYANLTARLGNHSQAEKDWKDVIARQQRILGAQHRDTLTSIIELSNTLRNLNKRHEAEASLKGALSALPETDPLRLTALRSYATVLTDQSRMPEAKAIHAQIVASRQQQQGERHPATLEAMESYANVLYATDDLSEAESILTRVIEGRRAVFGPEHRSTLRPQQLYASVLRALNRPAESEALLKQLMETNRKIYGPDHGETSYATMRYANALSTSGNYKDAEPLFIDVLAQLRKRKGNDHADTLLTMQYYSTMLLAAGRPAEAEPFCREGLEARRRILGERHPWTLKSYHLMGKAMQALGRVEEAETHLRTAYERSREVSGPKHRDTRDFGAVFADFLTSQHRMDEAQRVRDALTSATTTPTSNPTTPTGR